jgi:hypothetical protein
LLNVISNNRFKLDQGWAHRTPVSN